MGGQVGTIDSYIDRLEDAENGLGQEEVPALIKEVVSVFAGQIPDIKKGLDRYKARAVAIGSNYSPSHRTYDDVGDIRKLIGKLKLHRDSCCQTKEGDKSSGGIYMVQNANPSVSQNQNTTISVSVSQVLDAVKADDFSEDELKEIKSLILDAECNRENKSKLREIGKKIADFAFEKAVASLPILLSFVANLF